LTHAEIPPTRPTLSEFVPAIVAASAFGCADVLTKYTFIAGADVLTNTLFRGFVGLPMLALWLCVGVRPKPLGRRATVISLCIGVLFAGNVYWLFRAIELVPVPLAILTYFVYPLLTGLAAATLSHEAIGLRGAIAGIAAFFGLAALIGADIGGATLVGIGFALAAAATRVVILLVTRAQLGGADARLITWYSILTSTAVFVAMALASANWQPPQSAGGWAAMLGSSVAMTIALLCIFISTARVGPFRTALFMNLEPLIATLGSVLFLGETISPLQALGGAVMIAALVAFQMRR
jgi:drug/metabolite transporter (DMT)-like permease